MKRLIVAEKNDQAKKYATALGTQKKVGASYVIESLGVHIAPCAGHLLDIVNDASEVYKDIHHLPFFPDEMIYGFKPQGATKKDRDSHLKTLKFLYNNLKKEIAWADEIVIGTDPDREGESIFYTLMAQFPAHSHKVKYRLWANSLTKAGILKAYQNLRPVSETYNYYLEANARRTADWLVGVANITPLVRETLKNKGELKKTKPARGKTQAGYERLSVGRVKAPIMKLVIDNDEAINHHVPKAFWKVELQSGDIKFTNNQLFGGDKNELTKAEAEVYFTALKSEAIVTKIEKVEEIKSAPKLFNLTEFQAYMRKAHGMDSTKSTATAAKLYQDGFLSYPRTDSKEITSLEFAYLKQNLTAYKGLLGMEFETVNIQPRKKYVSDKDMAHYALIPTEKLPDLNTFSADERLVYETITHRMLLMFAADQKLAKTTITIDNGDDFSVIVKSYLKKGGQLWSRTLIKKSNHYLILLKGKF